MEDLVTVQAPSKHIRERVQSGSYNNHISIQADNGSLSADNGSLFPSRKEEAVSQRSFQTFMNFGIKSEVLM